MSFSFRFTSTHEDLLDADATLLRSRSGMRPWIRACLVGLGFMWLASVVAFGPKAFREGHAWQPIAWFLLGSFIVWNFLIQPIFKRRRIRTATPPAQPLVLDFTDSGLRVEAEGVGVFYRAWAEFACIKPAENGVAMEFTDGMVHWLPNRIFRDSDERQTFISFAISRFCPKEDEMVIRRIFERLRSLVKPTPLEKAQAEFQAAARETVDAVRRAREAGERFTPEMEAAGERMTAVVERLLQAKAHHDEVTGGPQPVELTESVARKVDQMFPADEQAQAIRLLEKECGRNLPFCENADAQDLERVRLAVVKLAGGNLAELRRQVDVAKQDWRDVLALAESPEAVKVGLFNVTKLDTEARRSIEERDRRQYEEWLRGDGGAAPPAA